MFSVFLSIEILLRINSNFQSLAWRLRLHWICQTAFISRNERKKERKKINERKKENKWKKECTHPHQMLTLSLLSYFLSLVSIAVVFLLFTSKVSFFATYIPSLYCISLQSFLQVCLFLCLYVYLYLCSSQL